MQKSVNPILDTVTGSSFNKIVHIMNNKCEKRKTKDKTRLRLIHYISTYSWVLWIGQPLWNWALGKRKMETTWGFFLWEGIREEEKLLKETMQMEQISHACDFQMWTNKQGQYVTRYNEERTSSYTSYIKGDAARNHTVDGMKQLGRMQEPSPCKKGVLLPLSLVLLALTSQRYCKKAWWKNFIQNTSGLCRIYSKYQDKIFACSSGVSDFSAWRLVVLFR